MLPRAQSLWYPAVPAWPSTGTTPAADLATHLGRFRAIDAVQPICSASPLAVLETPAPVSEPVTHFAGRGPSEAQDRPSSDLDAFLREAEKAVRDKRRASTTPQPMWRRALGSRPRIAGAVAAVLVVGATVMLAVSVAGGDEPERAVSADPASSVAPTDAASTTAAARAPACSPHTAGAGTTVSDGDDAGHQNSGAGAIRAFNHAYYVLRSAKSARAVTTPGAVASEYVMQQYIDQRPTGTRHCLKISERGPGEYSVVLTELQPDAAPITYRQVIHTTTVNGKVYIESIKAVE